MANIPKSQKRLLRLPDVIEQVGLSRTTIYDLIAAGRFPRQIYLSPRSVAWAQEDLDRWIAERRHAAQMVEITGRWPLNQ